MNYLRRSEERGQADFGWLDSKHSFSFGEYYDPNHMGVSALRVINDDRVAAGAGFDTHGHRDMEIISYVLEGAVRHEDSMGNQYVVPAGDVQIMSAGSGVMHSEFNDSNDTPVHFLQIWIQPREKGLKPEYGQKRIEQHNVLTPLVTADGREGSLLMNQDASLYRLQLGVEGATQTERSISLEGINQVRYLHVISGEISVNGVSIGPGDAAGFESGVPLSIELENVENVESVEALLFELPA